MKNAETGNRSNSKAKGKKRKRFDPVALIMTVTLICGIIMIIYPTVSDYWNKFHETRAIMGYNEVISKMKPVEFKKIFSRARKYNRRLAVNGINWNMTPEEKRDYRSQLIAPGTSVMGYISCPKIHVKLPIYHGTKESVLQTSIGHLEQTSLPIGGRTAHASLSGHRGMISAKLFTDLHLLRKGDIWTITVLNKTVTYEADQIKVVEPKDLSNLGIEDDKDYCTLITCTPLDLNTHRLLVRGHRIPNVDGDADVIADAVQIGPVYVAAILIGPLIILLLIRIAVAVNINRMRRMGPVPEMAW